jgi:hypothetical protein
MREDSDIPLRTMRALHALHMARISPENRKERGGEAKKSVVRTSM